jgi:hypothetical protein
MRHAKLAAGALVLALALGLGAGVFAGDSISVQGDYVEARTCDVWTGPCFSNSEMNLRGKNAVLGWSVAKGAWDGVPLDGLKVAAALSSEGTFHTAFEGQTKAVLFVDSKATDRQARALVALARALAPGRLATLVRVERQPIAFSRKGLEVSLEVGQVAKLKTKELCACDAICCHEEQAYPAFSESTRVECAKTLENAYQGKDLDASWSDPLRRGALVGTFAR